MNNLNVLYEDNHIIVIEKKQNIPVQEDSSKDLDYINIIKNYIKEKYAKKGNVYLGLVHRLDRPVGGIMVFAKTSKASSRLSKQIIDNIFHKEYLLVVHGKIIGNKILENKISRNMKTHSSYIDEKNGKISILKYKSLYYDKNNDLTLLKVDLKTGRHHQIRLQFSNINHPIYGDQRYGLQDKKQIALFAYKLSFVHPTTKKEMIFQILPEKKGVWKLLNEVNL